MNSCSRFDSEDGRVDPRLDVRWAAKQTRKVKMIDRIVESKSSTAVSILIGSEGFRGSLSEEMLLSSKVPVRERVSVGRDTVGMSFITNEICLYLEVTSHIYVVSQLSHTWLT